MIQIQKIKTKQNGFVPLNIGVCDLSEIWDLEFEIWNQYQILSINYSYNLQSEQGLGYWYGFDFHRNALRYTLHHPQI